MMKTILIILTLIVNIDIYQDASDPTRSIIVVEHDGISNYIPVDNKDFNDSLIDKIEAIVYPKGIYGNARKKNK